MTASTDKVLVLDVETMANKAWVWQLFDANVGLNQLIESGGIISWSAKFVDEPYTYFDSVWRNDKASMMLNLWNLMDEAAAVCGWNCLEVSTPVLTQDLRWVPVGDLKVGDKIVGFDEGKPMGEKLRLDGKWAGGKLKRKMRSAEVTGHELKSAECVRVVLSNGDSVITTKDHGWLSKGPKDNNQRWRTSAQLKSGYRVVKLCDVWEEDTSKEAGWLAGFLDGEGSCDMSSKARLMTFYQADGAVWDKAMRVARGMGFDIAVSQSLPPEKKEGYDGIHRNKAINRGAFVGGKWKTVEMLGRIRPSRFTVNWDEFGDITGQNTDEVFVVSVEDVGVRQIAVMSTSTKTFVGAGYAMHNCNRFDIRHINAEFAQLGWGPPSPYKKIDLMQTVRRHMKFPSNKLDYVSQALGVGRKLETGGFELWTGVMSGDKKAQKLMEDYNVQDVLLTEEVYHKLRPWIAPAINKSLELGHVCPECGGVHLQARGFRYNATTKYQRWQCNDCHSWSQSIVGEKLDRTQMLKKETM